MKGLLTRPQSPTRAGWGPLHFQLMMIGLPHYYLCRQPLLISLVVIHFACIALIRVQPVLAVPRVGVVLRITGVVNSLQSIVGSHSKGFLVVCASDVPGNAAPVTFWFG